jgi:hypothetical protein
MGGKRHVASTGNDKVHTVQYENAQGRDRELQYNEFKKIM